ncbi:MAG TPA: SUMF1/EgtB/PvdO family nonheme iron enzyme [Rhodospirillales bacterium]|jgi:formylglycine-generating enzyme required for sulfatase activity|nr:SUMF1/EgtB/PvdO family nonheme iron enzyme [Rhodospirillales bacterium]
MAASRGIEVTLKAGEMKGAPVAGKVLLYSTSHALVIGIDDYTAGWPDLKNAVKDAELVAAGLRGKGFDVTLRKNLTSEQLKRALDDFFVIKGDDPEARLFVWFAGHGQTLGGEGYLVPADAPLPSAGASFRRKALHLRLFGSWTRLARAKHALAVFDSCFSGTVFEASKGAPPPAITRKTTRPVRQFLTSGDANQKVSDDGMFRRLFLAALEGKEGADASHDGYLTASELGLFLGDRVTNYTEAAQTPRWGELRDPDFDKGDFVFVLPGRGDGSSAGGLGPGGGSPPEDERVWNNIRASGDISDFETFVSTYPDSPYSPFARNRIERLKERRVAVVVPPKPLYEIEEREEPYVLLVNANIRKGPGTGHEKLRTLRKGGEVMVTGKVRGQNWYRVALSGGGSGFVFGNLIRNKTGWERERAERRRREAELASVRPAPPPPFRPPKAEPAVGIYPGQSFKDCDVCPELVVVPPGEFKRGSSSGEGRWYVALGGQLDWIADETPPLQVGIRYAFAVGKYEVTFGEWDACVNAGGCSHRPDDHGWGRGARPVINVSWRDTREYVRWLSRKTRQKYRLMSETEWEYVARAGTTSLRYWGDDWDNREACRYDNTFDLSRASYSGPSAIGENPFQCDDGYSHTAPAGSFRPNSLGVYDLLGNVEEWVEDCYIDSNKEVPSDGSAVTTGPTCEFRSVRGGSWADFPRFVRTAERKQDLYDQRNDSRGFRIAKPLSD